MPKRNAKGTESRAWARTKGGMVKGQFTITPEQERALREEAFKRALASGSRKPDASAVLREALDEWLKRRGRG